MKAVSIFSLVAVTAAFTDRDSQRRVSRVPDPTRANAVVQAFRTSWTGYYENAFPDDTLRPVSNSSANDRNAWGVTAVDCLSTAIIMEQVDIVDTILDFISTIDFTTTAEANSEISVFETNIRYLGGLISAYDLLTGPWKTLISDPARVDVLLLQAIILADTISFAFDTPSGVPEGVIFLNPERRHKGSEINSIAGIGTLVLEWTRLSDLTGNDTYAQLVKKSESYLVDPTGVPEAFPGLVGWNVRLETGEFVDNEGGWGAGTDSFYEYLIKMYLYDPEEFAGYKDRWVLAADSTMEHLASHPTSREDLTFLLQFQGKNLRPSSGHLVSFAGGNFILGGILLQEQKYIDFGLQLVKSYHEVYRGTASGIGPEGFSWVDSGQTQGGRNNPAPPQDKAAFYEETGFWTSAPYYVLRPETIESLYHAYRLTGDDIYQDQAWEAFRRMLELCRVGSGFSGLRDVTRADGGKHDDFQESFWLAETLKYLYLTFGPESEVQLQPDGSSGWVFNTEAHPVKVRGAPS